VSHWNPLWEKTLADVEALAASVDMKVELHREQPYGWDLIDSDGHVHETGSIEWITSYLNTFIAARKTDPDIAVLRGLHWRRSSHAATCGQCVDDSRYIETFLPSKWKSQPEKEE
jgi:hypothetical protein